MFHLLNRVARSTATDARNMSAIVPPYVRSAAFYRRYNEPEAIDSVARGSVMSETQQLIPEPAIVRERISQNVREGYLLRSLLRVSIRAAEERHRDQQSKRELVTAQ
jgi:hypothetical protein